MKIRVLAAVALIASLPALWQADRRLLGIIGPNLGTPTAVFGFGTLIMGLTLPFFFAALVRSDRPLHFQKSLRKLSLVAIVCFAAFVAIGTVEYFENILGYWPWVQKIFGPYLVSPDPLPILPFLLSECANAAQLLLLVEFRRSADDEPQQQATRFLTFAAKTATLFYGLWAAFNVLRLVAVPYTYVQLRDYAWHLGRTPFTFVQVLGNLMPALLSSIAYFILPFMVWRAIARTKLAEQEAQRL